MNDRYTAVRNLASEHAPVVVETIGQIEKQRGRLSTKELAQELVDRSRSKKSPTHGLFEWDDRRAAEAHRLARATEIIAAVYVVFEEEPERPPVRAFPIVTVQGKKGPYPIRKVLASRDLTKAMLEEAKRDMVLFIQRYEGLKELARVFAAMRPLVKAKEKKSR